VAVLRHLPWPALKTFLVLQDIDEDDSGDESDESELESVAPLSKGPFKLGKYCQERARVFHEFSHWGMSSVSSSSHPRCD